MPAPPFTCHYTPNLPELLLEMQCSLAITTYQAGKLILISPENVNQLVQLPREFIKAMGLAVDGRRMAIATKEEVIVLSNARGLSGNYPSKPNCYDALFLPRAVYYTGEIDTHDMQWGQEGLYAVNTRFSCLSIIDDQYSIRPIWSPPFVTDFTPEDRCHLNGMAMYQDQPKYVTAFAPTNTAKGWRENILTSGIIIDIETNEIICDGLGMPHSPRIFDDQLYVLQSSKGLLCHVDTDSGKTTEICHIEGFIRGMEKWGDYLFIGLSKLRKNASVFRDLPFADKALESGVEVIYLPTGTSVANIRYKTSVDELYDIKILHGMLRPNVLNHYTDVHRRALNTPEYDFWSTDEP